MKHVSRKVASITIENIDKVVNTKFQQSCRKINYKRHVTAN